VLVTCEEEYVISYLSLDLWRVSAHLTARLEGLLALGAGEALLVIGLAHGADHLALHILLAICALGAVQPLIVRYAIVGVVLCEESAGGQGLLALAALEAGLVEVVVRHAEHLAGALLRAFRTVDFLFTCLRGKGDENEGRTTVSRA